MTIFERDTLEAAFDSRDAWHEAGHVAALVLRDTRFEVWVWNRRV